MPKTASYKNNYLAQNVKSAIVEDFYYANGLWMNIYSAKNIDNLAVGEYTPCNIAPTTELQTSLKNYLHKFS